jgi:hypothetical protein
VRLFVSGDAGMGETMHESLYLTAKFAGQVRVRPCQFSERRMATQTRLKRQKTPLEQVIQNPKVATHIWSTGLRDPKGESTPRRRTLAAWHRSRIAELLHPNHRRHGPRPVSRPRARRCPQPRRHARPHHSVPYAPTKAPAPPQPYDPKRTD